MGFTGTVYIENGDNQMQNHFTGFECMYFFEKMKSLEICLKTYYI